MTQEALVSAQANGHAQDAGHPGHAGEADLRLNRLELEVSYLEKHLAALRQALQRKGVVTYDDVLQIMYELEARSAVAGARVVARAWVDPAFKRRLLEAPKVACAELGIDLSDSGWELVVLENTERVHNVVVCTSCSCYAGVLVGGPPAWYKSWGYRGRVVDEPLDVLRQFGTEVAPGVEVRVLDTTRSRRAIVLPQRPAGTDDLSEDDLATLVTQESLFGVTRPHFPV